MSHDEHTSQERLTPEERRALLRDFADRMLLKVTSMDDPEDMPGVERAVRTAAVIERIYNRCDRAEAHAPDPRKLEAERARNANEATKARVALATTLEWGAKRSRDLGQWWDAADTSAQSPTRAQAPVPFPAAKAASPAAPDVTVASSVAPKSQPSAQVKPAVTFLDYTDAIQAARAQLGLKAAAYSLPPDTGDGPDPPSSA